MSIENAKRAIARVIRESCPLRSDPKARDFDKLFLDLAKFGQIESDQDVNDAIKNVPHIKKAMGPLVIVDRRFGFRPGTNVETVSYEEVRRAHLENGQYPAMNLQDANYDWTLLFVRAILDAPRSTLVICTDWFLTRELCAEVVVLRNWWRFWNPIWERTNFVWAALHCQKPFCFVDLMLEQYGDFNHLHIVPPETHLLQGQTLRDPIVQVPK